MNRDGNSSCLPSTMVFGLVLLAIFIILTTASTRGTTGSSKRSNTSQSTTSPSASSRLFAAQRAPTLPAPTRPAPAQPAQAQVARSQSTYTVKSGDTLFCIAARTGVALSDLEANNPQITDPRLIFPGQQLAIP